MLQTILAPIFLLDQRLLDVIGERSSAIVRLIAPLRYGEPGPALIETLGTQFSGIDVLCKHFERPYFAPAVSIISNYQNFTDCLNENQRWLAIAYTRNFSQERRFPASIINSCDPATRIAP